MSIDTNLKPIGNYQILKNIKNLQKFLDIANSEDLYSTVYCQKFKYKELLDGININNNLGKRYFCTKCNTLGPINENSENFRHNIIDCPNCSEGKLLNINSIYRGHLIDYFIYNKENNSIDFIDVNIGFEKNKHTTYVEYNKEIIDINIDIKPILFIEDNKLKFIKTEKINEEKKLKNIILDDFLNYNLNLKNKYNMIPEDVQIDIQNPLYILKLIEDKKLDIDAWMKNEETINIFHILVLKLTTLNYFDPIYNDQKPFYNKEWITPDMFLSNYSSEFINICFRKYPEEYINYNNRYYTISRRTNLLDFHKYNKEINDNLIFLNNIDKDLLDTLSFIIGDKTNYISLFDFVDEYIKAFLKIKQTYQIDDKDINDILINYLRQNIELYVLYEKRRFYENISLLESLLIKMKYLQDNNKEINNFNLNNKNFNRIVNIANMNEHYDLPSLKINTFHNMIDKDPLKAYSFIKNRRQPTKKEIEEINNILKK